MTGNGANAFWIVAAIALTGLLLNIVHGENPSMSKPTNSQSSPSGGDAKLETITFASGCFWCTEAVFQQLKGVKSVASGYSGGKVTDPTYEQVCGGRTGHAECIQVTYDPAEIALTDLLRVFWQTHDPTTPNRQGNDVGTQYRSAIFYHTDEQRKLAEEYKKQLDLAGTFGAPIVTEITAFTNFYPAENYHQDYFEQNPVAGLLPVCDSAEGGEVPEGIWRPVGHGAASGDNEAVAIEGGGGWGVAREYDPLAEWLEADGLGGFASGTVCGRRTRRYHALLLAATAPPAGRMVLVNGIEASIEAGGRTFAISSQHYAPDVNYPDGDRRIESFEPEPWPRWLYLLENGIRVEQELFVPHGQPTVAMRWRVLDPVAGGRDGAEPIWLSVRPLVSGRDYHALHHENPAFRFDAVTNGQRVSWYSYHGVPSVTVTSNAEYRHGPMWYRNFLYQQEVERGLDATEDLASSGEFRWNLSAGDAVWIVSAAGLADSPAATGDAVEVFRGLRAREKRRRAQFAAPLERAADAYVVRRGAGRTIIAGYPWFTDWGRDTFIAMRGLVIATGRLDVAREILLAWAGTVSEGMLPNRFPDHGDAPEFNSVDASLWYVIAVDEFLAALEQTGELLASQDEQAIAAAVLAILEGYIRGTRYGIRVDDDGLLAAGEPGLQLTWMDVKVGDWVVTPRIGKPVELQALWLSALWIAEQRWPGGGPWTALRQRGQESFVATVLECGAWLFVRCGGRRPRRRPRGSDAASEPDIGGRRIAAGAGERHAGKADCRGG